MGLPTTVEGWDLYEGASIDAVTALRKGVEESRKAYLKAIEGIKPSWNGYLSSEKRRELIRKVYPSMKAFRAAQSEWENDGAGDSEVNHLGYVFVLQVLKEKFDEDTYKTVLWSM